jgi:hypothetical protein
MSLSITTAFLLLSLFILGAIFFIINYSAHIHTYAQFQNNMSSLSLSGVNITSPQRGQQIPVNVNLQTAVQGQRMTIQDGFFFLDPITHPLKKEQMKSLQSCHVSLIA